MKKVVSLVFAIALLGVCGQVAYGCSCREGDPNRKVNYKKWLKDFNGAVFVGEVVRIEAESRHQVKVTFQVETYWKGAEAAEAIIYTANDGAACGVTYVEGKKYFVVADRSQGKFYTDLCSWLDYSKNEKAYLKGLGKGKSPGQKACWIYPQGSLKRGCS